MNSQSDNPLFDMQDLLIRQALSDVTVPQAAKNRARQRLALAALESSAEDSNIVDYLGELNSATADTRSMLAQSDMQAVPVSNSGLSDVAPSVSTRVKSGLGRPGNWLVMHRRLASSLAIAASVILATGVYFLARPLDRLQLVAICSQHLDEQLDPQPAWTITEAEDLPDWLRSMGLNQMPQFISQVSLPKAPLGNSGQLWRLTYEGQKDLYVLELHGAVSIEGVGGGVQVLQTSSNRWAVAALQNDQQLLVIMTKGSLEHYLQLVPLA